jgi:hypothetical protein
MKDLLMKGLCSVEFFVVHEAVEENDDGAPRGMGKYFESKEEAEEFSGPRTWSGKGRSEKHYALHLIDGTGRIFLIEREIDILHTVQDAKDKKKALEKLTPRERKLLGL